MKRKFLLNKKKLTEEVFTYFWTDGQEMIEEYNRMEEWYGILEEDYDTKEYGDYNISLYVKWNYKEKEELYLECEFNYDRLVKGGYIIEEVKN